MTGLEGLMRSLGVLVLAAPAALMAILVIPLFIGLLDRMAG